jgi:hypothetical protein
MKASVLFGVSAIALTLAGTSFADQKKRVKVENKDHDADTSVTTSKSTPTSTTTTTAANYDSRRDVVESRAEDRREVRGDRWTVAPQVGAATGGYGFGVGARVGYTFHTPIYVGGNFMYHTSGDVPGSERAFYPSAEVGYDIGMGPVLFRPYVGAGALMRDAASTSGLVYPGATIAYLIKDTPAFVGADGRVLLPTADNANNAIAISGTAGVNF